MSDAGLPYLALTASFQKVVILFCDRLTDSNNYGYHNEYKNTILGRFHPRTLVESRPNSHTIRHKLYTPPENTNSPIGLPVMNLSFTTLATAPLSDGRHFCRTVTSPRPKGMTSTTEWACYFNKQNWSALATPGNSSSHSSSSSSPSPFCFHDLM